MTSNGSVESPDDLSRLCRRFEIAVGNFGRSCIALRANEKAFQAWYAACVIQEFGLSRVYREVHLRTDELFELAGDNPFIAGLKGGTECFPDLSVSWQPDVDARHSSTRSVKHTGDMLKQFGILSELKVTGSTGTPTSPMLIRRDLAKLALFAGARRIASKDRFSSLATYMVVLDNFCGSDGARPHYCDGSMDDLLAEINEWPDGVPKPVVLVLFPNGDMATVETYRDFQRQTSTQVPTTEGSAAVSPRRQITEEEFLKKLAQSRSAAVVESVRALLREIPSHKLSLNWGVNGPAFHYRNAKVPKRFFSFGFLTGDGFFGFGWIDEQCEKAGMPRRVGADYLIELEQMLPSGEDGTPEVTALLGKKAEWFATVDRTIDRIARNLVKST